MIKKESRKTREALTLINGRIAARHGYQLTPSSLIICGAVFPITKNVYNRLKQLNY